jgi:hypothetical protein
MIYSHEHKFVYFSIPKTGSTTISNILIEKFGGILSYDRHDNRVPEDMKDYYKFATVRNPYERALSGYKYIYRKLGKSLSLGGCFSRFHFVPMTVYLNNEFKIERYATVHDPYISFMSKNPGPGLKLNAFLRCENLESDFNNLYFVDKKIILTKENVSINEIDSFMVKKIAYRAAIFFTEDFKVFGYKINDPNINSNRKLPFFC